MAEETEASFVACFADLPDPRSERNREHPFMSILIIALCGTLCGADNWVEIEAYGKAKQEWLETIIQLRMGYPRMTRLGGCFV